MKNGKKLTAAVAVSAVATALVAPAAMAATTNFTDIQGNFAADAINALAAQGIIHGNPDGTYNPNGQVTREQFAIILAGALKLDTTKYSTTSFTDVDGYAAAYVEAAHAAGLISGYDATHFGGKDNLTRQDMAAIFVRALKYAVNYDATGKASNLTFSDKGSIATYAQDAVGAAVELGLIHGMPDGTFAPTGTATRAQVAYVANAFLGQVATLGTAQLTGATLVDNSTITLNFSKAVTTLSATDVAVAVKATNTAVNVQSATLSADGMSATVKVDALAAGTTYTVTYAGKSFDVATQAQLAVASVNAINAQEIAVTFNGAVDSTTAQEAANYSIYKNGSATALVATTDYTATLQPDNKTVLLKLTNPLADGNSYVVDVSGVLDTAYNAVTSYSGSSVLFNDTTAPTLSSATLSGTKVKLTFSEPVVATGLIVKIDGTVVSDGSATLVTANSTNAGDYAMLTPDLTGSSLIGLGQHTVTVYNATDLVGNETAVATTTLNVGASSAPSVVSVTPNTSNSFLVKFSEPLATVGGLTADDFTIKNGNYTFNDDAVNTDATSTHVVDVQPYTTDTSGQTYIVTLNDEDANNPLFASGSNTTNLSLAIAGYFDSNAMLGAAYSGNLTLTQDLNGPKLVASGLNSVAADTSDATKTELKVKFDENLNTTAVNVGDIQVTENNITVPVDAATVVDPTDNSYLDIYLDGVVSAGTYNVSLGAGAVADTSYNYNVAQTTTAGYSISSNYLDVESSTNPGTSTHLATVNTADDSITINYGHAMNNNAISLANYQLDGQALPTGSTIAFFNDNTQVKITFPANTFAGTTTQSMFTISSNVTSQDGYVALNSGGGTDQFLLTFNGNTKPVLKTAEFLTNSSSDTTTQYIELTYSEAVQLAAASTGTDAGILDDYAVTVNGVSVAVSQVSAIPSATADVGGNVILKLANPINISQAVKVTVTPVGSSNPVMETVDAAGNTLTGGTVVTVANVTETPTGY